VTAPIRAKLGDSPVALAPTSEPGTVALIHERRKRDRRQLHEVRKLGPRENSRSERRTIFAPYGRRKHD
jgi:hypothetical protein